MWIVECSPERPWGIHPCVRNDEACPRCGWTAPGPLSDALADAAEVAAAQALAGANELGWALFEGGAGAAEDGPDTALAA
jgi:hypothetical protein